ncbi:MAG: hypothetical protein E7Z65_06220 [Thermoplasmata archaeon]|nr:hypothetical protein [Thermoplasmata archaeon]
MTSWMECGCGGDVVLYENPGEERFGRKWFLLTGNCKRCGMYHETVPLADLKEFRRLMEEDEVRRYREQLEKEEKEYRRHLASLTPEELLEEVGPDHYPWFYVRIHNTPGRGGSIQRALTLQTAREAGTAVAEKGQYITIEQHFKTIEEWRHGERPELKKYHVHCEWDYTVHDTGAHENAMRTINCGSLEDARRVAHSEERYWTNRPTNTFFRWNITDEDGNFVEASV